MAARIAWTWTTGVGAWAQRVIAALVGLVLIGSGPWAMLVPESFYASGFVLGLSATLGFTLALGDGLLVGLAAWRARPAGLPPD